MKKILSLLIIFIIIFLSACSKENKPKKTELIVAAGSSMTDVLTELAQLYEENNPEITVTGVFGSSSTLQAQIEEGAPVDIFVSASPKQVNVLENKNLVLENTNKALLKNELVLIVPYSSTLNIKSFDDLPMKDVKTIAVGDPVSVPAGEYTEQVFKNLNILDEVKGKSVYGTDVRTVLTWVENEDADCGVVYRTDAINNGRVTIIATAPDKTHDQIVYPVAIIKNTKHTQDAKDFYDFLFSEEAKQVFIKYGFELA